MLPYETPFLPVWWPTRKTPRRAWIGCLLLDDSVVIQSVQNVLALGNLSLQTEFALVGMLEVGPLLFGRNVSFHKWWCACTRDEYSDRGCQIWRKPGTRGSLAFSMFSSCILI